MALNAKFLADFTDIERGAKDATQQLQLFEGDAEKAAAALAHMETSARAAAAPVNDLQGAFSQVDSVLASVGVHAGPQIKALSEIGAASGKTAADLGIVATSGLAMGVGMAAWGLTRAAMEFFELDEAVSITWAKLLGFGDVAAEVAGANADKLAEASRRTGQTITDLGVATEILNAGLGAFRTNAELSAIKVVAWQAELAKVGDELPSLTADLASQNFSLQELAARYHVSVEALQFFTRETKAAADAEKAASDASHERNARLLHDLDVEMKARAQARDLAAKVLLELTKLEQEYAVTAISRTGTTNQIQTAAITASFAIQKAELEKQGRFNADVAAQWERNWHQALDGVGVDFQTLSTKSIPALQELAANALRTYNAMVVSGQFSREELDKQLAKYHELQDAARGYGKESVAAQEAAAKASAKHTKELEAQKLAIEAAADAERRRKAGGSFDVTSANFGSTLAGMGLGGGGEDLARQGYSLAEIVAILRGGHKGFPTGPRIPGFAGGVENYGGGWAMVGERGPEPMYVPQGASIFPSGSGAGGATSVHVDMKVSGLLDARTIRQLTAGVKTEIVDGLLKAGWRPPLAVRR